VRHRDRSMRANTETVQSKQCVQHSGVRHRDRPMRANTETVHSKQCVQHSGVRHRDRSMRANTDNVPAGERPVPRRGYLRPEHRGMFSRPSQGERDVVRRRRGRGPMLPGWGLQLRSLMATCGQKSGPPELRPVLVSGLAAAPAPRSPRPALAAAAPQPVKNRRGTISLRVEGMAWTVHAGLLASVWR